jgi:hypothetical protein
MVELTADEFEQLEHLLRQVLNEATARHPALKERVL